MISREDMAILLRQLAGGSLTEEELSQLIGAVFEQAGVALLGGGIDAAAFGRFLGAVDVSNMTVEVPAEL